MREHLLSAQCSVEISVGSRSEVSRLQDNDGTSVPYLELRISAFVEDADGKFPCELIEYSPGSCRAIGNYRVINLASCLGSCQRVRRNNYVFLRDMEKYDLSTESLVYQNYFCLSKY